MSPNILTPTTVAPNVNPQGSTAAGGLTNYGPAILGIEIAILVVVIVFALIFLWRQRRRDQAMFSGGIDRNQQSYYGGQSMYGGASVYRRPDGNTESFVSINASRIKNRAFLELLCE